MNLSAYTRRTPDAYLYGAVIAALLVVGTVFRSWGVLTGTLDFWSDEARWAARLAYKSMVEAGFRPIGYFWLSQKLTVFENQELALRLPSYVAALGTMLSVYLCARRLITARVVVVLVLFLVALHPNLIALAKEFKPYALETFAHSGFTLWALHSYAMRRVSAAFIPAALVTFLFSYNIVFLYPGMLLMLLSVRQPGAVTAVRDRLYSLPKPWLAASAVAAAVAAVVVHVAFYDALDAGGQRAYWGEKYGVFPVGLHAWQGAAWYLKETWALVTWPAMLYGGVTPAVTIGAHILGVAFVGGVVTLAANRRFVELALLAGPLAMVALANALGYWPYGAFRTNTFLIPSITLVAGLGLQQLASVRRWRAVVATFAILLMLAAVPHDPGYFRVKHSAQGVASPQLTDVIEEIEARYFAEPVAVNVVVAESHAWRPMQYYFEFSPWGRDRYATLRENIPLLRQRTEGLEMLTAHLEEIYASALAGDDDTRIWIVYTPQYFAAILDHPLVREFEVYRRAFTTRDARYHPVLVELFVPRGGAE